jgi:hypothetical protein
MSSVKTKMIFGLEPLAAALAVSVNPTARAKIAAAKTIRGYTEETRIIMKPGVKNPKTAIAKNNSIPRHIGQLSRPIYSIAC